MLIHVVFFNSQVLPETLQVVGRIAHVQVWDYLDKIKSSSSKVGFEINIITMCAKIYVHQCYVKYVLLVYCMGLSLEMAPNG